MLPANSPEKVDPFFVPLAIESKNLRKIAKDFANYLPTNSFSFPEKGAPLKALHEVAISKIETIDMAINNLKRQLMLANKKLVHPEIQNILGKHTQELEVFIGESAAMSNAMHGLVS